MILTELSENTLDTFLQITIKKKKAVKAIFMLSY